MGRGRRKLWPFKLCGLLTSLICLTAASGEETQTDTAENHTPVSPPQACATLPRQRFLMLVGTLDGKVSALDVRDGGKIVWSISTGEPLLSSSISKLEINRKGVLTRLIPSLDGGLYQFDGESIEAVPFTADTLLSSSFRLNDDTTVVGGKSIETYGVDVKSGQIKYMCTTEGCQQYGDKVTEDDNILVVSRNSRTVRAVELKTGTERWNFSVGQHQLDYLKSKADPAHITDQSEDDDDDGIHILSCNPSGDSWIPADFEGPQSGELDLELKVMVPSGLVMAVKKSDPNTIIWKHTFGSALANVWTLQKGDLKRMDLFNENHVPALSGSGASGADGNEPTGRPVLYLGVHMDQLYVQPSARMMGDITRNINKPGSLTVRMPRVKWQPYIATAPSRTPAVVHPRNPLQIGWQRPVDEGPDEDQYGLVPWHQQYPFDSGFYVFSDKRPMPLPEAKNNDTSSSSEGDDYGLTDVSITLWNWWKEVLAISIVMSAVVHIAIAHIVKYRHAALPAPESKGSTASEGSGEKSTTSVESMTDDTKKHNEYVSRYYTDFEQEECLGKGGFGVVFHAKNKIDDCSYAVKRIALNNSDKAKEKVMREVKALAKLDNAGIVRYYQAWFENPPPGWQEEKDKLLVVDAVSTPGASGSEFTTWSRASPTSHDDLSSVASSENAGHGKNHHRMFGGLSDISEASVSQEQKRGGSSGFITHHHDIDQDESGSYSIGTPPKRLTCDNSLDIVFQDSDHDLTSSHSSSQGSKSVGQSFPFKAYQKLDSRNDLSNSFEVIFEDSGCGDKSSNGSLGQEVLHSSAGGSDDTTGDDYHGGSLSTPVASSKSSNETLLSTTPTRPNQLTVSKQLQGNKLPLLTTPTSKLYLYIQMQLCKRESLKEWLSANTQDRDDMYIMDIFYQMLSAVDYVHESGLMHRDLKPSNIFFAMDGTVKVGDFGLVTALEEQVNEEELNPTGQSPYRKHTDQVGTMMYMSPEQVAGKNYSHKVDIFSLGMIFFELFYSFSTQMERVKTLLDVKKSVFPPRFVRERSREHLLVKNLLAHDPDDRPSTKEILDESLVKDFVETQMASGVYSRGGRTRSRTISNCSDNSNLSVTEVS